MRNRIVVATAVFVTMLLAAGTGLALASTPDRVPAAPVVAAAPAPGVPTSTDVPTPTPAVGAPVAPAPGITAEGAASIALARVGAGRVTEIEREFEHGRREWKVEIVEGPREHDVRVDASSGQITRTDVDDRG